MAARNPFFDLLIPIKRDVFVSYHHADQLTKDLFVLEFAGMNGVFTDRSLDDRVDSRQPDYVHRKIREDYITGTSVTVVLCGEETGKRKYVDWEIHSTLLKRHRLLGIIVPGTPDLATTADDRRAGVKRYLVPDRFADNMSNGYALLYRWPQSGEELRTWLDQSVDRARMITPDNSRAQMAANVP